MEYSITKQIRIHHEDGWFYQFTDDGESIEIDYYELIDGTETTQGNYLRISKDCIENFITVLQELK